MSTRLALHEQLPLGTFSFQGVGWDKPMVRFGGACWTLNRDGFAEVTVTYRNLLQEKDWTLGPWSPGVTDQEIAEWMAATGDFTACDWVRIGDQMMVVSPDRGTA